MRHDWKQMNYKKAAIAASICAVLLVAALYFYFSGGKSLKPEIAQGKPLVHVQRVVRADMMRHVSLSGQTVAEANISLAPKYTGRIVAVNAELGDEVRAGDILMVQDTEDLDISIRQNSAAARAAEENALEAEVSYDANYIMARNALSLEQGKYERNQYLFSIGAISQDTLDSVEQEYLAKKAAFEVLENQAENGSPASVEAKRYTAQQQGVATEALRKQREDLILRAPRDGIIGYRNAEVGAMVTAGTRVFSLVDTRRLYVDCMMSENDAAILEAGQDVVMTIDALGREVAGRIIYVSPAMDESSKTYTVRVQMDETEGNIKAGLFARGQIDILQRPGTIAVPKAAVFNRNGHSAVFLVRDDGTVEEREVRTGLINDSESEILSGIAEGDVVVLNNQDKLKNGDAVEQAEDAS
ncbi:MAG: efflux RND transporter periplasmic adaptor subunit [Selenomonadaceae bacterium]|nr:efflux RND transporter periplasmic adaptor subunit [Selenomonadaceae bacterium]